MEIIFDEYDMRKLPPRERLDKIMKILRNERDESITMGFYLACRGDN